MQLGHFMARAGAAAVVAPIPGSIDEVIGSALLIAGVATMKGGIDMAKLYWRVKVNGSWTWQPATDDNTIVMAPSIEAIAMCPGRLWNLQVRPWLELEEEE
eukprot:gene18795-biopygen907